MIECRTRVITAACGRSRNPGSAQRLDWLVSHFVRMRLGRISLCSLRSSTRFRLQLSNWHLRRPTNMCRRRLELKALAVCGRCPPDCRDAKSRQSTWHADCTPTAAGAASAGAVEDAPLRASAVVPCAPLQPADVWQPNASGLLPIHVAALAGQCRTLAALLATDLRLVDAKTHDGCTALLGAAACGQLLAAKQLLQAGADANTPNTRNGQTPLHAAAALPGGAPELICTLLNAGADLASMDSNGRTAIHVAAEAACRHTGSLPALLRLARHRPCLLGAAAGDGATALHAICHHLSADRSAALQALQALASCGTLHSGAAALQAVDGAGHTPLALAAAADCLPAVQLLLSRGADPSTDTCLACSSGTQEVLAVNSPWGSRVALQRSLQHHTCPLGIAVMRSSYAVMLALLRAGASAAGLADHALGRTIAVSRADAASALLASGLQCRNARPLAAAVERCDGRMLAALLDAGWCLGECVVHWRSRVARIVGKLAHAQTQVCPPPESNPGSACLAACRAGPKLPRGR